MNCWSCAQPVDAFDHYCRRCGIGLGDKLPWYYHPGWIVFLALFAAGPFVLPLIWKTPKLGPRGRKIGTGLVVLLTLYLIYGFFQAISMLKTSLAGAVDLNSLK